MVMLKVLTQYHEATGDPRVLPALDEILRAITCGRPAEAAEGVGRLSLGRRAVSRAVALQPDRRSALLELARMLHDQGDDWKRQFANFEFTSKTSRSSSR